MMKFKNKLFFAVQICLLAVVLSALIMPDWYDQPFIVALFTSMGIVGACFIALSFKGVEKKRRYYRDTIIK